MPMKKLSFVLVFLLSISAMGQDAPAQARVNKTMMVNFLKSLVIPGWGQWSNGHKAKAGVFMLAEVATIAGYQSNYTQAEDEARAFKIYANEHWYYGRWIANNGGNVEETACGNLRTHEMRTLLDPHGDPILDENGFAIPLKDHHYFENISKYPEFICGWDDIADYYAEDGKDYTPNKREYIDMRTHSNQLYRNAQLASTLLFANHLVSAIDAAFGTDITSFETTTYSGKLYINPLNALSSIKLEVRF
jgi:hypothetical protein